MAYYAQHMDKEALKAFQQAVRRDKKWANGHAGVGLVYMRMSNRGLDARTSLRTAMKLNPEDANIQYYFGMTFMDKDKKIKLLGSERDGRKYFMKTIALDAFHPDAFYQLGRCYEEDPEPDYEAAMLAYIKQLWVTLDHPDALTHFARASHYSGRYQHGAALLSQLSRNHGDKTPIVVQTMLTQFKALALRSQGNYDQMLQALEMYITQLDDSEKALYYDLAYVALEDELTSYQASPDSAKDALREVFWASRDPNPATVVNERLVEHYQRIMYARIHFSNGSYPWDRRGEIYVRYGEPDDRRQFLYRTFEDAYAGYQPSGHPAVDAIREKNLQFGYQLRVGRGEVAVLYGEDVAKRKGFGAPSIRTEGSIPFLERSRRATTSNVYPVESWVYVPFEMELFFVDQMGSGAYDYPLMTLTIDAGAPDPTVSAIGEARRETVHHPKRIAAELMEHTPDDYRYDFGGPPLEYAFDALTFRGPEGETEVEFTYSIPTHQLGYVRDGKGLHTWLLNNITFRDTSLIPVTTWEGKFGPIERALNEQPRRQYTAPAYMMATMFQTPPGVYNMAVQIRDEATRGIGIYKKPLTIPDYHGENLLMSDLKLATAITPVEEEGPFVRKGLEISPNPGRLYQRGQIVYLYYEVYNLSRKSDGKTEYEAIYEITPKGMPTGRGRNRRQDEDEQSVLISVDGAGSSEDEPMYTSLDTGEFVDGEYVLTVILTDRQSGQRISKTVNFMIVGFQ